MSLQRIVAWLLRVVLRVYFRRLERFHAERVPRSGPVIFACNHPSSLMDAFVIGTSLPRPVFFVATVQLFRFKPLAWLLSHCGVIPVNRVRDDASAMRSVMATFEACFRVLERGEAIGIFPEGITHDDPQLKPIKTGTARMALELEHRHGGKLGLQIVPVGLNFSAKEKYRSQVLIHFGEPLAVASFLNGYEARRRECIHALHDELERRLQALIVHVPRLEHARVVQAVKRLYLERLRLGNIVIHEPLSPQAEELVLTQAITDAVEFGFASFPERAEQFVRRLAVYEGWLERLKLSDAAVEQLGQRGGIVWPSLARAALAVLGAPLAFYGGLHRLAPLAVVRWSVRRFTKAQKGLAQVSTTAILAGMVSFGFFYGIYALLFGQFFSLRATVVYALSLPLTGLLAHYYFRNLRRLAHGVWDTLVLLRLPIGRGRLRALRAELIAEIERVREEYRQSLERRSPPAPGP